MRDEEDMAAENVQNLSDGTVAVEFYPLHPHPRQAHQAMTQKSLKTDIVALSSLLRTGEDGPACILEAWVEGMDGQSLSTICPPGFRIQHQPRHDGQA